MIDEIFAVSHLFFEQPAADKRRLLRDADNPWGYFDKELTKNRQDCKEIYDFGPDSGDGRGPRWPDGPLRARFEPAVRACYASCAALSMRLLAAIASNLGVEPAGTGARLRRRRTHELPAPELLPDVCAATTPATPVSARSASASTPTPAR